MATDEEKERGRKARDDFNTIYTPMRHIPEFKKGQDEMNYWVNKVLDPQPEPPDPEPPDNGWQPDPPELKTKLKFLEFDFLGWYVDDFLPTAWDDLEQAKKNMDAVLKRANAEMEGDYPSAWSGFLVLSSGRAEHNHCNRKLPWRINDGKIDWYNFNPKWWKILGEFYGMLRLYGIEPKPQAFMDGVYNQWIYANNVNGVTNQWSADAFQAQVYFVRELLKHGKWIKFINEPRLKAVFPGDSSPSLHGGDHIIADWHRDMFYAVQDLTDLEHLIVDVSMRECAFAQLIEFSAGERACPKCGIEWDNPPGSNRKLRHEKHGLTCEEGLEGGERNWFSLDGLIRSAWHAVKGSEDGGFYPEAKGYRLFDYKVSWGTAVQYSNMCRIAWERCLASSRKKEFYAGIWAAECFVETVYGLRQIYKPSTIIWKRFRDVRKVHRELHG